MRGLGRIAVEKDTPRPGWQELPVDRFWELLRAALAQALGEAGVGAREISGISYSSQANTFVLLDAADAPLTPLVLWTDTRAEAAPAEYEAFSQTPAFAQTVGFKGMAVDSAVVKWNWFQRHEPGRWSRMRRHLTVSDYLTFALTGEPVGDASTAALLGLYHLHERGWWREALQAFAVDPARLATPLRPGTPCGRTTDAAMGLLGIPSGIPFAVGALDHHAAALGAGLETFADASISTGTVLAALCVVDAVEPMPRCYHGPHTDGARYYRLAYNPAGTGRLDRLHRESAPDRTIEDLVAEAGRLAPGCRRAVSPWSRASDSSDVPRAARLLMDEMAHAHRILLDTVSGGRRLSRISATGGGARSAGWLALTADVLGVPIVTSSCPERACLGAAAFAAVAAGIYQSIGQATAAMVRPGREFAPGK